MSSPINKSRHSVLPEGNVGLPCIACHNSHGATVVVVTSSRLKTAQNGSHRRAVSCRMQMLTTV